jgi:hypothetical protein
MTDITSKIIAYESGEATTWDILEMYAELIKTGMILGLQGTYQREARHLIDEGIIDQNGNIIDTSKLNAT